VIRSAFGERATCENWYKRFREGDFNLKDRKRLGKLEKFEDEEMQHLPHQNSVQRNLLCKHFRSAT